MKTLFKNAYVVDVFTESLKEADVLIEDDKIIGVGDYNDADNIIDCSGKFICPGFIDGHIHIESTLMKPYELSKALLKRGTTSIVADPHEIANVCGVDGINYMIKASEGLPLHVYFMLPSCVPATPFCESKKNLYAKDLLPLYENKRVLGLAEMMNYPGVIYNDKDVLEKIKDARRLDKIVDGHAPMLSGDKLDIYLSNQIQSDHECFSLIEAKERISKGQWLMIREGTAAHNLEALIDTFDYPYCNRCLLVTDDRHPIDIINVGHIDNIIKKAYKLGKDIVRGIKLATINAATCFKLSYVGAIAPGYRADILVLDDLEELNIIDVYSNGVKVVSNKELINYNEPIADSSKITKSFNLSLLNKDDFYINPKSNKVRVIEVIPHQLLTKESIEILDFNKNNGINLDKDIIKLAVIERHNNTRHKGLGYIKGLHLKRGAFASSVSHDSHNLIVVGTNEDDMVFAANEIIKLGGGMVVVNDGKVISSLPLPYAGLMSDKDVYTLAKENEELANGLKYITDIDDSSVSMTTSFVSLPVIPSLKMSTKGLVDVDKFKMVDLFIEE